MAYLFHGSQPDVPNQPHCRTSTDQHLRTSKMCENLNLQIKRLTRVIGLSPNENSVLRLVTAVLIEASEEWKPANPTSLSSRHML